MKRGLAVICVLLLTSSPFVGKETSTFHVYVDSDLCARLMLGPITSSRIACSRKTETEGSNSVLVRLTDNTVFDINKPKLVKDHIGGFGLIVGEAKIKSGTLKLHSFKPEERTDIPSGAEQRLLDPATYSTSHSAVTWEKVRHELAMMPYISVFDFISFALIGNTVILTGWTVRDTNRSDAYHRAKSVESVEEVINNIELLPLGSADMEIRAGARAVLQRSLSRYFWSNGSDIKIVVKNGNIILLGSVATQQDVDLATIQCNSVSYSFHVFNMLRVTPPKPKKTG